jgi:hypothetical protein
VVTKGSVVDKVRLAEERNEMKKYLTKEQTDKIFSVNTSNGCREMGEDRFHQAVNEAINFSNQGQAEVKSDGERKLIISIKNDTVLFDNLNDFKPLEFMGILHNAISTADVLYKTKIMQLVEKASKSV